MKLVLGSFILDYYIEDIVFQRQKVIQKSQNEAEVSQKLYGFEERLIGLGYVEVDPKNETNDGNNPKYY